MNKYATSLDAAREIARNIDAARNNPSGRVAVVFGETLYDIGTARQLLNAYEGNADYLRPIRGLAKRMGDTSTRFSVARREPVKTRIERVRTEIYLATTTRPGYADTTANRAQFSFCFCLGDD